MRATIITKYVIRDCFIDNDSAQTLSSFCKVAIEVHPGIRRSKCSDEMWAQYIFEMAESFCSDANHKKKTVVTCVGRQPDSDIWVLAPHIQINIDGQKIDESDEEYFW